MKVILVAVVSANGKLTRGEDPDIYKWTSPEDQDFFFGLIKKSSLIVMGSGTYESVKDLIKHDAKRLRIVLTKNPKKYKKETISGRLEFTFESPRELVARCMIDHTSMLLVGGSKVYSSFMKAGLIDEIYLTIEPVIFGKGKNLFADEEFESKLKLVSIRKFNKKGTIMLKYQVIK